MDSITNQFPLQIDVKGKCNESNQPHSSQKFYNELETLGTAAAVKIGIKPSINSLFIGRQNFFQVQRIRKMSSTWGFLFRFVPLQSNQELHRSLWATWWWCTVSVAEKQNTFCSYRFFVLLFRNPIQMLPTRWTRDDYTSMGRCVHPYYQNLKNIYILTYWFLLSEAHCPNIKCVQLKMTLPRLWSDALMNFTSCHGKRQQSIAASISYTATKSQQNGLTEASLFSSFSPGYWCFAVDGAFDGPSADYCVYRSL